MATKKQHSTETSNDGQRLRPCSLCGDDLPRLARSEADARMEGLVHFDLVRASEILERLVHENHGKPDREKAAYKAFARVEFDLRRILVPERLSQREYVAAIRKARNALQDFRDVARRRETEETKKERATFGEWAGLRPARITRRAIRLTGMLLRSLRWLEHKWTIPSTIDFLPEATELHATLVGTVETSSGRRHKMALAEVFAILATAFSHREIAELDLDGQLEEYHGANKLEPAKRRVAEALRNHRARAEAIEASQDPELIQEVLASLRYDEATRSK